MKLFALTLIIAAVGLAMAVLLQMTPAVAACAPAGC
jgi:hypothetical protein